MNSVQRKAFQRHSLGTLAPHCVHCNPRLALHSARVLNKSRPKLPDISWSTETTDEERPISSGNITSITDVSRILFEAKHVSDWRPELLAYAPLGLALAAFRSALWIMGIALDQPWFRNQNVVEVYLRLLGVEVNWRHVERIPSTRHVMVSNHCSVGDLMMLFCHPSLPQRYTHLITSSLPARITQSKHLPVVLRPASPAVYDELASTSDPSPVHLFPEGGMTNGRGMLRFSRGFTRIMQRQPQPASPADPGHSEYVAGSLPVVPVALRVNGMPGVNTHTLTSSFLSNLFWFSFSPKTKLEATVLPAMTPLPGEARGAFVNRVQAAIASELGVAVYEMTIQQKRQVGKMAMEAKR